MPNPPADKSNEDRIRARIYRGEFRMIKHFAFGRNCGGFHIHLLRLLFVALLRRRLRQRLRSMWVLLRPMRRRFVRRRLGTKLLKLLDVQ